MGYRVILDFSTVYPLASMNKGMVIVLHHTDHVHYLLLKDSTVPGLRREQYIQ